MSQKHHVTLRESLYLHNQGSFASLTPSQSDHLGSTSMVLDANGGVLEQQRYLPFAPIASTDLTYTGQRALDGGMGGVMDYKARFYSPALGRFIQPDTMIPGVANPQSWNRYAYGLNNPSRYTDPTGHRPDDGCRGDGGCSITKKTIEDDIRRDKDFKDTTERNKCKAGNKLHCSYAENHPVETVAFVAGGLLVAGVGATVVANATAAEGTMVGLNVAIDCVTTKLTGSQCSAKNALITYAFSLITGGIRGRIADLLMPGALAGPGGLLGLIGANIALTFASNSAQRAAKGNPTMDDNAKADMISGGVSTTVQMATALQMGDPAIIGPIGQATSGIISALLGPFNPIHDPVYTIFPAPQ